MRLPLWLLLASVGLFLSGLAAEAEEPIVMALFGVVAAGVSYIVALRKRLSQIEGGGPRVKRGGQLEARLMEIEQRLSLTESELESANLQIDRLRAERDFDKLLIGSANSGKTAGMETSLSMD